MKPFFKKKSTGSKSSEHHLISGIQKKNCIDLEELMEIENARQRALFQNSDVSYEQLLPDFFPLRIFINHVDSFNGSHYVKWLSQITNKKLSEANRSGTKEEVDSESLEEELSQDESNGEEEVEEENEKEEEGEKDDSFVNDSEEDFSKQQNQFFEIIGTLDFINNPKYKKHENISELLDNEKKIEFLEKLLTCGIIIYDITGDLSCHPIQIEEAKWIAELMVKRLENFESCRPKLFAKYKDCRTFILISPLLTWAKTKPIDPDDRNLPFTERDFRKRKPHPNYKLHWELEKRIIELGKKYPNLFRTIVIGTGVPYGDEEDILACYFKMAWQNVPHLPIFKPGTNVVPLIHINTLCSLLQSIIELFPQKYKYIIATDPNYTTLIEIVKLLAENLSNGKTVMVNKEEAFLYPEIKQKNYDMLTNDLHIVPGYILDNATIVWNSEKSFTENISKLIADFKHARGLMPIKIFMHGPPASGRSFLAKRLSSYYGIPYLNIRGVIEEAIQDLKEKIQAINEKKYRAEEKEKGDRIVIEGDEETDEEFEDYNGEDFSGENLQTLKDRLKQLELDKDNLSEEQILRLFKDKLLSHECQNKGYVIDGYPKTLELTKLLYEPTENDIKLEGEDATDVGQGDVSHLYNAKIMPTFIESLDASDDFLIDKMIKIPEISFHDSYFAESEMCRKLIEFREQNTEDNTPLIFYDELDFHPLIYNVEHDLDPQMETTFKSIIQHIGPVSHYWRKEAGLEDIIEEQRQLNKQKDEMRAQREEIRKAAQERRDSIENWMFLKNQEVEMEEKALLVMGMPLRHYLMKYIFPTLTRGLVEVARIRPKDPLDYLSEFLFRENPDGKMFHPDYEEKERRLDSALKEYEESITGKKSSDIKTSDKTFSSEKSARSGVVSNIAHLKCSLISSKISKKSKSSRSKSRISKLTPEKTRESKDSIKSDSWGVCTCQKSPSLSTCSSDITPSTLTTNSPSSCTCTSSESCEPCEPCDDEKTGQEKEDGEKIRRKRSGEYDRSERDGGSGGAKTERDEVCKCPCELAKKNKKN